MCGLDVGVRVYPLQDDDQDTLSAVVEAGPTRKGTKEYRARGIDRRRVGMGGTWREGHFDTGFGLKNDLQCQTGGIGIQRRPAIPVKQFHFSL